MKNLRRTSALAPAEAMPKRVRSVVESGEDEEVLARLMGRTSMEESVVEAKRLLSSIPVCGRMYG